MFQNFPKEEVPFSFSKATQTSPFCLSPLNNYMTIRQIRVLEWKISGPTHASYHDHTSKWDLVEHPLNILHVTTFCIHANQAIPHNITIPFTFK